MFAEQHALNALDAALLHYSARRVAAIKPTDRFVHYTSSEAASKIILGDESGSRSIWLRNSRVMNDFTEVEWGQTCLSDVLRNWRLLGRFKRALEQIHPSLFETISKSLINEQRTLGDSTFLLSLSLHNQQESLTGKLSMWRAYGVPDNVCLVFNTSQFMRHQTAYELVLSPVMYGGSNEFSLEFEGVIQRLEQNVALFRMINPTQTFINLKRALDFAVLSTKHPGFHEESEWRLIHQHSELRPDPPALNVEFDGAKQIVHRIPFHNRPEVDLWGLELTEILERVIIGPTSDVHGTIERFVGLLRSGGVSSPEERVVFCGIPLRR